VESEGVVLLRGQRLEPPADVVVLVEELAHQLSVDGLVGRGKAALLEQPLSERRCA
jgi:hypothetical protein